MYLLYLDESGDPNSWQDQKCYVLGGVAIHEGQVYRLSMQIESIQDKYFPEVTIPIAFHCTDIRGGKGHFRALTPNIREQILDDIYSIIANAGFPNLIAFATALDISCAQNQTQVRRDTLEDVVTRFNTFLIRQFKAKRPSKGLLIIDENRAQQYRELVDDFKREGMAH